MALLRSKKFTTLLALIIVLSKGVQSSFNETTQNNPNVLEKWMKIDQMLKTGTANLMKKILPLILEYSNKVNVSSQCMRESMQLFSGLRNLKTWAVKFIDSSGKTIDGLMSGTTTSLGVFDECLDAVATKSRDPNKVLFRGQYCALDIKLPVPPKTKRYRLPDPVEELKNFSGSEVMKFFADKANTFYFPNTRMFFGICIPSGCSYQDVEEIAKLAASKLFITVDVSHCEVKEKNNYSNIVVWIIFTCGFLGLLVVIGTFLDEYGRLKSIHFKNIVVRVLLAFSLVTNFKKLVSTKTTNVDLSCLHGIRYLSITWVIMGHAYLFSAMYMFIHMSPLKMAEKMNSFMSQTITNSSLVLSTFFFISGLLLSYLTIKHVKIDKKRFDWKMYIIHRLWRLLPVYSLVTMFSMLTPLMGSGPIFKDVMKYLLGGCHAYWWTNFLFINNFYMADNQCLPHIWYVSCDFQLYLLALLVLLPMMRSQKIGITLSLIVILISIIYPGIVTYLNDLQPTLSGLYIIDKTYCDLFLIYTYENPITNAGPYFLGIIVGNILVTKPKITLSWKIEVLGWCLAVISALSTLYASYLWQNYRIASLIEATMYASFYKVAWSFSVAWVAYQCINGRGGFINSFLSWPLWKVLSKLVFTMYLVQPVLQLTYIAVTKSIREYTHLHLIMEFFGYLCISTLLAFVAAMMAEFPFAGLEGLLFRKDRKRNDGKPVEIKMNAAVESEVRKETEVEIKSAKNLEEGIDNTAFSNDV